MRLFKKNVRGGANKNDVKVAKIELEKAKIEREIQKEKDFGDKEKNVTQREETSIEGYLEYSRVNFERIENIVLTLKNNVEKSVEKIRSAEKTKLNFKEKSEIRKIKESCELQLKYMYLSKDYVLYLSQYASGIDLDEEKTSLIVKFAAYFDGVPVIEAEENGDYDDDDDSIIGEFKSMFKEIGSAIYKPKSSKSEKTPKFYFYEYLEKYYYEKINKFVIPEITSIIETFKKVIFASVNDNLIEDKVGSSNDFIECSNCYSNIDANSKFCPDCGNKIEVSKPMFCEECGFSLNSDSKFCPNCGQKI